MTQWVDRIHRQGVMRLSLSSESAGAVPPAIGLIKNGELSKRITPFGLEVADVIVADAAPVRAASALFSSPGLRLPNHGGAPFLPYQTPNECCGGWEGSYGLCEGGNPCKRSPPWRPRIDGSPSLCSPAGFAPAWSRLAGRGATAGPAVLVLAARRDDREKAVFVGAFGWNRVCSSTTFF